MKKLFLLLVLVNLFIIPRMSEASAYRQLLEKYVDRRGMVNYRAMFRDPLFTTAKRHFRLHLSRKIYGIRLKTLLINAYNFYVMERIRQFYPIKKVISIKAFFNGSFILYRGKRISLNTLEKQILFKKFRDPLLHFVLVCGAKSCPPIYRRPYTSYHLSSQLRRQTRLFLRSRDGLRKGSSSIRVSKIFKWYKHDFGGSRRAIIRFINRFNKQHISLTSRINFLYYNWALNGW